MLGKLGSIAVGSVLLLGSLAVPVAAQGGPSVRYLNAVPGVRVDICVAGQEVASDLAYGKASELLAIATGTVNVQARVARTGRCTGAKVATRAIMVDLDTNDTLVLWRPKDKVTFKVFENDISLPEPTAVTLLVRHTARAGAFDAWVWKQVKPSADDYFLPTFDDIAKGSSSAPLVLDEGQVLIEAFPSTKSANWSYEFLWQYFFNGGAYEAYFIGTQRSNYQIVLLGQKGTPPSP